MKNKLLHNKQINRTLWVVLLLTGWQAVAMSGIFSPLIFPSIPDILKSLFQSIASGEIIHETLFSITIVIKGLLIGFMGALILSSLAIYSKTINGLVETLTSIFSPLPGVALLPLIIIWLGTGSRSVVFIIVHSAIWPMILNILNGFRTVPDIYKKVGTNIGLGATGVIRHIMLPSSLPYLLTGIRIGWARAWRALISAEMIFGAGSGKGGLGWYIFKQRTFMDTPGMFAGLLVIVAIGIFVEDVVLNRVENNTVKKWGMMK